MKSRFILVLSPMLLLLGCSDRDQPQPPSPPSAPSADSALKPSSTSAGRPVELKARWIEGKRYIEHVESNQRSVMTSNTRPEPVPQTVSTSQEYAVDVAHAAERTELGVEFLSFAIHMTQGSQQLSFDSKETVTDTNQQQLAASVGKLVGQRVKFFMTPSNTVDEIEGAERLAQELTTNAPPQAQFILGGVINPSTLEHMVEIYHGLPDKPVSPGDSWPAQLEFSLGPLGTALLHATNTFTGWAEKNNTRCALIKYKGILERKTDSPPAPLGGIPEMRNGTLHGQSWFDPELGAMLESVTEQSMSILITFPTPQAAPRTHVVTNSIHTSVTHKLVEVRDVP